LAQRGRAKLWPNFAAAGNSSHKAFIFEMPRPEAKKEAACLGNLR
jgi:hypothetical protein